MSTTTHPQALPQPYPQPTLPPRNSATTILTSTTLTTLTGASIGTLLAAFRGQSRLSYAFSMGANWAVVSLPFFSIREAILQYRYSQNERNGTDSFKMRDKDDVIASMISGGVVGGGLGLLWRGPKAIIAGSLMYSAIATGLQTVYLLGHHWRLNKALQQHIQESSPNQEIEKPFSLARFWDREILRKDPHLPPDKGKEIDPVGAVFMWAKNKINENVEVPDWTSPLLNAWDVEYRKRLNVRLKVLESQVGELRRNVGELKEELGDVERTVSYK